MDITIQSESRIELRKRNGRYFIVRSNSSFTLGEVVTVYGTGISQSGGIEVHNAIFNLEGGGIRYCSADLGGGVFLLIMQSSI